MVFIVLHFGAAGCLLFFVFATAVLILFCLMFLFPRAHLRLLSFRAGQIAYNVRATDAVAGLPT